MTVIRLPIDGAEVLIDEEDRPLVAGYRWGLLRQDGRTYARASHGGVSVYMHRLLTSAAAGEDVDHRNGNGLDNRRNNLRRCGRSQNLANQGKQRLRRPVSSRFKGVFWDKSRNRWQAQIAKPEGNARRSLGRFESEEAAAHAYDDAAYAQWGEFARLNFEREVAA